MSDKICEREGFSVIKEKNLNPDQFTSFNQGKYQMMQKLEQGKPVNSYLFNTAVAVDKSIEISKNRTDFIKNMNSQGYETKWSDTNKNVTFKDLEGHKVRLSNLEKTFNNKNFSKEEIENGFSRIKEKELAKHRESNGTERNRGGGDTKGFGLSWDKSEVGTPACGANNIKQQNVESDGAKREGQKGINKETPRERNDEGRANPVSKQSTISLENRSRGSEESQLSENRGINQEIERGIKGESRLSQQDDKGHTGISISSKEHSETIMEGKSETILNSVGNNSRLDSGNSGSVSTGNPFSEALKALDGAIKKMEYKEQALADKESAKLEKEMNRQPKIKSKSKEKGWYNER